MNVPEHKVESAQPSLIKALMAGFDAISSHIGLIIFPVALDLLLWFGPRLRFARLLKPLLEDTAAMSNLQTAGGPDTLRAAYEQSLQWTEQFNILSVLRAFPFGVPSLMSGAAPVTSPIGILWTWEAPSFGVTFILWVALVLAGLAFGALYFHLVSQAALTGSLDWRQSLAGWPWAALQFMLLAVTWFLLYMGAFLPLSCIISLLVISGLSSFAIFLVLFGMVLGLFMLGLLAFVPHGILVNRRWLGSALVDCIKLTLQTPFTTLGFLLVAGSLVYLLDILWHVPEPDSWMALIGVLGHAFITTVVLAASFIYYRDAVGWAQHLHYKKKSSSIIG